MKAIAALEPRKVETIDIDEPELGPEDVLSVVDELTGGEGVNVAVEAVGLPETFRLAVDVVAFAGRVIYIL
ncbi:MAG: zinc-binding dehydrogenase [Candidatus Bipolaricaulia bacterium]